MAEETVVEETEETTEAVAEEATEQMPRVRKRGGAGAGGFTTELRPSDIPYPAEVHGDDFEEYSSAGYAASVWGEIAANSMEQEFILDEEKLKYLHFDKPGRNLPKKRLYKIVGIHKDGRLVQLPFEPQVQNNAGGDPEDAIGLRRYQRKGIHLLIDFQSLVPIYCAAWGCWAQATYTGNYVGFCTLRHAQHTLPNNYKDASEITKGLMEMGVTTSRTWAA